MRRQSFVLIILIAGLMILSVNFTGPYQVVRGASTAAVPQSPSVVNLALINASQSSTDTINGIFADASRAVDGNTNGNMSSGSVSQTLSEVHAWWEVDLGAVAYIDTIKVYNRTDCCGEIVQYLLLVSDVPFVPHDLDATRNQRGVTSQFGLLNSAPSHSFDVNHTGRYVRIQVLGNVAKPLHLAEVQVLGIPLPTAPAIAGQWQPVQPDLPDIPVHISLLPSGKLLFWGRDKGPDTGSDNVDDVEGGCNTFLWDPSKTDNPSSPQDERVLLIRNNRTNLFCAGHSFLPDGDLFVAGGAENAVDSNGNKRTDMDGQGPRETNIFDYLTETWRPGPTMNQRRWYPSVVTLSNGETLIVSGNYVSGFNNANQPIRELNKDTEILDRSQNLRLTPNAITVTLPNYPFTHLGPDGNALVVSGANQTGLSYNPSTNIWSATSNLNLLGAHDQGTSVMYDKGKIMVMGGLRGMTSVTNTSELIDLNPPNPPNPSWVPTWASATPMRFRRYFATSVLMPDGQVFVSGGSRCGGTNNLQDPTLELTTCRDGAIMHPEIYNPVTGLWSIMARQQSVRMYHSVALLMQDGRILVAGGGRPGAYGENGHLGYDKYLAHREVEIFSPPYLFNSNGTAATRPVITNPANGPLNITYGQSFSVGIGNFSANQIGEVVLVRLPSVTHALSFDQRRVVLSKNVLDSQTLSVTAPANGIDCPPGPYMLFVFGPNGAPSVAKMILLDASATNPPGGLVATAVSAAAVSITWTASGGPVHHYEVDRRRSILAPWIKIADVNPPNTSYTDLDVTSPVGYLYRVRAVNSAGHSSQPSNTDLATTVIFTDNPLIAGVTVIKAQHMNALRVAVNAARATAELQPASWTDDSLQGVIVKAAHIIELRQNFHQALLAMELTPPTYTDPIINTGLIVKRAHVEELRQAVR